MKDISKMSGRELRIELQLLRRAVEIAERFDRECICYTVEELGVMQRYSQNGCPSCQFDAALEEWRKT